MVFWKDLALEDVGADFIIIGENTAHVLADEIQKRVKAPIIHIVDATAEKIREKKFKKGGFLDS